MKKITEWFKESGRYKHLGLGILAGTLANSWYCTVYGGIGVAGALELKDKLWGGKWDWIDFGLTCVGFGTGYGIRIIILSCF